MNLACAPTGTQTLTSIPHRYQQAWTLIMFTTIRPSFPTLIPSDPNAGLMIPVLRSIWWPSLGALEDVLASTSPTQSCSAVSHVSLGCMVGWGIRVRRVPWRSSRRGRGMWGWWKICSSHLWEKGRRGWGLWSRSERISHEIYG